MPNIPNPPPITPRPNPPLLQNFEQYCGPSNGPVDMHGEGHSVMDVIRRVEEGHLKKGGVNDPPITPKPHFRPPAQVPLSSRPSPDLYVKEALHSYKVLMSYIGMDTAANKILLKWPDAMISYMSGDKKAYLDDMRILICLPIKILIEAISEQYFDKTGKVFKEIDGEPIDPIELKKMLIRICNERIVELNKVNDKIQEIITEDKEWAEVSRKAREKFCKENP